MRQRCSWITCPASACLLSAAFAALLTIGLANQVHAAVSYATIGSTYTQNFDSLPTDTRTNNNIETGASPPQVNYPTGWTDDMATPPAGAISLEGWHLYHPVPQGGEGGANDHQRLRFGSGSNTGSFYGFANVDATNPEKALGSSSSTTMAVQGDSMYVALRLTNNTGQTLNRFTLTYDGEQWRDGGGGAETLVFGYSAAATAADWFVPGSVTAASSLNFVAPVTAGSDSNVDGNLAAGSGGGRVDNISASVTGFSWAPGADLWLRWADLSIAGNDDNLAIDDVEFSADVGGVGPTVITSIISGLASDASTWSNNQPPSAANAYHVVSGHTVTVNAPFPGNELRATSGGVVSFSTSGVLVPFLAVDAGGNVTETASGDFALGDINAATLGTLVANEDLTFSMDAGADFFLDMKLYGVGDLNFNSNGSGSNLELTAAGNHQGTIRFNGTGDQVRIIRSEGFNILEMNSTGANTLVYDGTAILTAGTAIFNQPGVIDHASNNNRLQSPALLIANAPVTVDLTKTFSGNERRFNAIDGLQGTANITVNGTAIDPTGGSVTHNEFEVGSSSEPGSVTTSTYSGTITTNDFVDVEIRHNLPQARLVINEDGRLEMGHQRIPNARTISLGEVVINSGGTLEVGFEEDNEHNAYRLQLVSSGGRSGELTLADGSTVVMQVNGTAVNRFDSVTADGDVTLDGTLSILVNPAGSPEPNTMQMNPSYTPTIGDKFDIIKIAAGPAVPGDYSGNGSVGPEDYDLWASKFGTNDAATDGNGNGVVDAADYVIWRKNEGATGGTGATITGTFDNVLITDSPAGLFSGFDFQVNYSSTLVQLEVVSAGSGSIGAVPEPATLVLAGLLLPLAALRRGALGRRRD